MTPLEHALRGLLDAALAHGTIDAAPLARALFEAAPTAARARALALGVAGGGARLAEPLDGSALADALEGCEPDATALAAARLLTALSPERGRQALDRLLDRLAEDEEASDEAIERGLEAALDLWRETPSEALAARAVDLAELGALEPAAALLAERDDLAALLETLEFQLSDDERRDPQLRLLRALHRAANPAARLAFLGRHLEADPRLLDEAIALAQQLGDWEQLLELARRGLSLREDRARYNALAAEAMAQLGQPLP